MDVAGVDGCPSGWIVIKKNITDNTIEYKLCNNFKEVIDYTIKCKMVAVDMPIGLSLKERRECDIQARNMLKPRKRANSVFNAPVFSVISDQIDYASRQNYKQKYDAHIKVAGWGITIQSFCIFKKLYEVNKDDVNVNLIKERKNIKEFHPELVWAARSSGAIPAKKNAKDKNKDNIGKEFRLAILHQELKMTLEEIKNVIKKIKGATTKVAVDDIIDAMGGLLAAQDMIQNRNCIAPAQTSANGLNMEIWY